MIRAHRARADTPTGFEQLGQGLSERQRSLLTLLSTVMEPTRLAEVRDSLVVGNDVDDDFEALPATADDASIDALAERIASHVVEAERSRPGLRDPFAGSPAGEEEAQKVLAHAFVELFNPAQLRVLQRVEELRGKEAHHHGHERA